MGLASLLPQVLMTGDVETLLSLISADVDLNQILTVGPGQGTGRSSLVRPLTLAALYGQRQVVSLLLDHGADLHATSPTLLWHMSRDMPQVILPLVASTSGAGQTTGSFHTMATTWQDLNAVSAAALWGHHETVKDLLDRGADILQHDSTGQCLFTSICACGLYDVVETIVKHENPAGQYLLKKFDPSGYPFLCHAIKSGNVALVDYMKEQGAVFFTDCEAALQRRVKGSAITDAIHSRTDALLLDRVIEWVGPPDPSELFHHCRGAIVYRRSASLSKLLHVSGGRVTTPVDEDGQSLLHQAARSLGNSDAVRVLLSHGWKANLLDAFANTPLITALASDDKGHRDGEVEATVRLLLEAGAQTNNPEPPREPPLFLAITRLHHFNIIKLLVDGGASVNATDLMGSTPLFRLLRDMIEMPRIPRSQEYMDWARKCLQLLIERGCDVNHQNCAQLSPLHVVMKLPLALPLARLLVRHGADINIRNKLGDTPLTTAVAGEHTDGVRYLLHQGCQLPGPVNLADLARRGRHLSYRAKGSKRLRVSSKWLEIQRVLCHAGWDWEYAAKHAATDDLARHAAGGPLLPLTLKGHCCRAVWTELRPRHVDSLALLGLPNQLREYLVLFGVDQSSDSSIIYDPI